jgi:hypothetical protein
MNTDRLIDIVTAGISGAFAIIGITELIGFLLTWKWHCLLLAVMCMSMVWVWYQEDYKSKGKKLNTLWQKKNTKH